jgi:uncharacterized protein (DUF1778 family)
MAAMVKRRKPATARKEAHINIRLTQSAKDELSEAAGALGLSVSAWLVMLGLKEARREGGK